MKRRKVCQAVVLEARRRLEIVDRAALRKRIARITAGLGPDATREAVTDALLADPIVSRVLRASDVAFSGAA